VGVLFVILLHLKILPKAKKKPQCHSRDRDTCTGKLSWLQSPRGTMSVLLVGGGVAVAGKPRVS